MNKVTKGFILPSAAFTVQRKQVRFYRKPDLPPRPGDLMYGEVVRIGQHSTLENKEGRIHVIHDGTKAVFVFGNRYAPDYYEGFVPEQQQREVDLLARSGLIGQVAVKNSSIKDPTRVKMLGCLCNENGDPLNTLQFPLIEPKNMEKKEPRAKLILVCGTAMNSGKSIAAVACTWALTAMGHKVKACKVTGTASLKDILHMNDSGAETYADFTYFGHPSTYMLSKEELLGIFHKLDLKYANNPKNFWVVELADGILQRETAMLLESPEVQRRIHRLVFCSADAFGAIGGLRVLRERFNLVPDAISGVCSSSPLHVRELGELTDIPVFNSLDVGLDIMADILLD